jgi:hypothetical protein
MIRIRRYGLLEPQTSGSPGYQEMKVKDYEFETEKEAWDWFTKEIIDYKLRNNVVNEDDKSFNRFRAELIDIIYGALNQHYDDYENCKKCPPEDHSGYKNMLCRCISRNMRLARERRKKGESEWQLRKKLFDTE